MEAGDVDVSPIPLDWLPDIFSLASAVKVSLRTTLYSHAAVHRVIWTPQSIESVSENLKSQSVFASSDCTALHVHDAAVATAWLWTGKCVCCGTQRWTIEVGDMQNHLALALSVEDAARESEWRRWIDFYLS